MVMVNSNGVRLYAEETGSGTPIVFVHEFAGDHRSWEPQVRSLSRRYRCITFNARGYPPSDVPQDSEQYSATHAVDDIAAVLRHFGIDKAHIVGLSMGGYAALNFGLRYPHMARSLVVAGAASGSGPSTGKKFLDECAALANLLLEKGMEAGSQHYASHATRRHYKAKDPRGFDEFCRQFAEHSALGSALTMRGYQMRRPSVMELAPQLQKMEVPTLIVAGDDDAPCLEPALFLKQTIPSAMLWIVPRTTHQINLEEPDAFNRSVLDFISSIDQKG